MKERTKSFSINLIIVLNNSIITVGINTILLNVRVKKNIFIYILKDNVVLSHNWSLDSIILLKWEFDQGSELVSTVHIYIYGPNKNRTQLYDTRGSAISDYGTK